MVSRHRVAAQCCRQLRECTACVRHLCGWERGSEGRTGADGHAVDAAGFAGALPAGQGSVISAEASVGIIVRDVAARLV